MKTDYKDIVKLNSTAQTNEDLFSEQPDKGERFVFNNISIEDETTSYTFLRLGVSRGGVIFWLVEEKSPHAAELYWYEKDLYIYSGERVIARFNGTTDADRLAMYLVGYRETLDKN